MFKTTYFKTIDWDIKLKDTSHPETLVVEVTTTCNLDCIHCFRKSVRGFQQSSMNIDLFKKIIDEAIETGVNRIVFTGWGEPFTHPNIDYIIAITKKKGFEVVVNTNGFNLVKYIDLVVNNVDELYVSLDAITMDTYSIIRKPGSLSNVVNSIYEIAKIKHIRVSNKPVIKAIYTVQSLNFNEIKEFIESAAKIGINEVVLSHVIPHSASIKRECMDSIECIEKFENELKTLLGELGLKLGYTRVTKPIGFKAIPECPYVERRALFIRHDGAVTPCMNYAYTWYPRILGVDREVKEIVLGYIGRDELIDIWREKYVNMFYNLYFKKIPSCLTCSLLEYCLPTRSNEYDCLGNSPACDFCPYYNRLTYCPV